MAKLNLKGLTIERLLNMTEDDLLALAKQGLNRSTMTEKEFVKARRDQMAQIVSRVVSTANKRINQLSKSKIGQSSPAYQQVKNMSPSGKFSVRGKDFNQLRHTLKEAKEWLNYKTSTTKGWKEVRARIREDVGMNFDTTYKSKKFWKAYRILHEANAGIIRGKGSVSRLSSDRIQRILSATITQQKDASGKRALNWRNSVDDIVQQAQKNIDNIYNFEKRGTTDTTDVGASRIIDDLDDMDEE